MKLDIFNHIQPKAYFDKMLEIAGDHKDMGKRTRAIPCLYDLDVRFKVMDLFGDYAQIICLPGPPVEVLAKPAQAIELAKIANDGMAELVQKYPHRFKGFIASPPMNAPKEALLEVERAIRELGAVGIELFSNAAGKPLDHPDFAPIFDYMAKVDKPIWLHPIRSADMSDYKSEERSKYEIWWTFGWPYETSAALARLVFSKTMDRHPNLKVIAHHMGGMISFFEGRVGPGWDQLGTRTSDEDYVSLLKSMKKRPIDYFRDFYVDTAVFGSEAATKCGMNFWPIEHILFASDSPFDPEKGPGYIRETIRIIDNLDISEIDREKIYCGNAEKLLGIKVS